MLSYVTNYAEVRLPNLKAEQNRARKQTEIEESGRPVVFRSSCTVSISSN